MKITNPTDTKITIQFLGTKYSVEALDTIEVSKEVAEFWKGIHGFIQVSDGVSDTKIEVKPIEVKVTETKEIKEDIEVKEAIEEVVKTTIKKSVDKLKTK